MKTTKKRLEQIIQEEYQFHARRKKRKLTEGSDRESRRAHVGDAIHDVMWVAVMNYLLEMGFDEAAIQRIEARIDGELNDIAVSLSHMIGQAKEFGSGEMYESSLIDAIAEALEEEGIVEGGGLPPNDVGLGDGLRLGGNYNVGHSGYSGESPDQTIVKGVKR